MITETGEDWFNDRAMRIWSKEAMAAVTANDQHIRWSPPVIEPFTKPVIPCKAPPSNQGQPMKNRTKKRWRARTRHQGISHWIGYFSSQEEAKAAVLQYREDMGWPISKEEQSHMAQATYSFNKSIGMHG